ncbi:MAG TPA: hypothetical protein VGC65_00230 [Bacteroidia bacterium]|jgi:hypothetical protein
MSTYYSKQTIDNINEILKSQDKTFAEMALDLKNDPTDLHQELFTGMISLIKMGSIAEYLKMPIETLFGDSLDINRNNDINYEKELEEENRKHEERKDAEQRVVISALVLSQRSVKLTDDAGDVSLNKECKFSVKIADGLLKALKQKKDGNP